jgi:hypothetical protein
MKTYIIIIKKLLSQSENIVLPSEALLALLHDYIKKSKKSYQHRNHVLAAIRIVAAINKHTLDFRDNTPIDTLIEKQLNSINVSHMNPNGDFTLLIKTFLSFYPHYIAKLKQHIVQHFSPQPYLLTLETDIKKLLLKLDFNRIDIGAEIYEGLAIVTVGGKSFNEISHEEKLKELTACQAAEALGELARFIPENLFPKVVRAIAKLHTSKPRETADDLYKAATKALEALIPFMPTALLEELTYKFCEEKPWKHHVNNEDAIEETLMNFATECCGNSNSDLLKKLIYRLSSKSIPLNKSKQEILIAKLVSLYPANLAAAWVRDLCENELNISHPQKALVAIRILSFFYKTLSDNTLKDTIYAHLTKILSSRNFEMKFAATHVLRHYMDPDDTAIIKKIFRNLLIALTFNNIDQNKLAIDALNEHSDLHLPIELESDIINAIENYLRTTHDFCAPIEALKKYARLDEMALKEKITSLWDKTFKAGCHHSRRTYDWAPQQLEWLQNNLSLLEIEIKLTALNKLFSDISNLAHTSSVPVFFLLKSIIKNIPENSKQSAINILVKLLSNTSALYERDRENIVIVLRDLQANLNPQVKSTVSKRVLELFSKFSHYQYGLTKTFIDYSGLLCAYQQRTLIMKYITKLKEKNIQTAEDNWWEEDELLHLFYSLNNFINLIPVDLKPTIITLLTNKFVSCPSKLQFIITKLIKGLADKALYEKLEYSFMPYFVIAYHEHNHKVNINPLTTSIAEFYEDCMLRTNLKAVLDNNEDLAKTVMDYASPRLTP